MQIGNLKECVFTLWHHPTNKAPIASLKPTYVAQRRHSSVVSRSQRVGCLNWCSCHSASGPKCCWQRPAGWPKTKIGVRRMNKADILAVR